MSLRNKIVFRICGLVFLMVLSICLAGSFFETQHRQKDALDSIKARVIVIANAAGSLNLQPQQFGPLQMISQLNKFHPSVDVVFIAKDNLLHLAPHSKNVPPVFLEWWDENNQDLTIHEIQDEDGVIFLDIATPIGENSAFVLHTVLVKNQLGLKAHKAVKIIFLLGAVAFLLTIPVAMGVANRTTMEVDILTQKLNRHGDELEDLVRQRTTDLNRFKYIVSETPNHMSFVDTKYIYRTINEAYLKAFGKSRDEIIGHSILEIFGKEIFENQIKEKFDLCLQGKKITYQAWFEFPELGQRFMDVAYSPLKEENGSISGLVVSSRDITQIKQAEVSLRESENRFHALFEGTRVGVAIYSAVDGGKDFVFKDYNPAGQKMDGISKKDAIGHRVTEVFPGVQEFGMLGVLQRVWSTGTPEEHPISIYQDDKIKFWRHNSVFKSPSGEVVAVYTDETAKMQAKEALTEQHNRFVTVLDSLDAVVYVADMDTHEILFANKLVRDQFGDCIGKPCWQAIQTGQTGPCDFCTNDRLLDEHDQPNEPWIWEFKNTADEQWYQCRDQAITWTDGRLVRIEIATNITDRKLAEELSLQQGRFLKILGDATQMLLANSGSVPYQGFLDLIGPASNAAQAYIFLNPSENGDMEPFTQSAGWSHENVGTMLQNIIDDETILDRVIKEGTLHSTLKNSSEPIREFLESNKIQSSLIIPIMDNLQLVGLLWFTNCLAGSGWTPMEQTYLESAAIDMAQAIKRSRSENIVRESLKEKEVLLREIHHRVKNNMQVVTSLLNLQSRKISDEQAQAAIRESQDRIHVMSLVHESLYQSDDLHSIAMNQYFNRLASDIAKLHTATGKNIQCLIETENVVLSINNAIPIGLIANELVTNAFKHAFPDETEGKIQVSLKKTGDESVELIVSDNGVGISEAIEPENSKTLGLQLVSRLATGQLGGTFEIKRENGSAFHIRFSPSKSFD